MSEVEDEIRRRLEEILPSVVVDGRPIFTNRDFNPHGLLPANYGPEGDQLLQLSRRAERLRAHLGLLDGNSPSALYLVACAEAADLSNHHRLGPRRLAERVLRDLRAV